MWPVIMLTSGLLLTLAACAHQTPTAAIEAPPKVAPNTVNQAVAQAAIQALAPEGAAKELACLSWKTITFDRLKDTLETISEVKASNSAREAFCQ